MTTAVIAVMIINDDSDVGDGDDNDETRSIQLHFISLQLKPCFYPPPLSASPPTHTEHTYSSFASQATNERNKQFSSGKK